MLSRDDILRMAREAGWNWPEVHTTSIEDRLERFASLVAAAERKACLEIADQCADADMHASMAANAIRAARSKT